MISYLLTPQQQARLKALDQRFLQTYAVIQSLSDDERAAIHRYARISNVGASTRIENALLTDSEISWLDTVLTDSGKVTAFAENKHLIENKLSKDRERSIEEVAGCRALLLLIYEHGKELMPLHESAIKSLHRELLKPYLKNSRFVGQYKLQPNSVIEVDHVTKKTRIVFKTADAGPITESAMHDLLSWYNSNICSELWPVSVVVEFVFRFLAIHPFQDGNGRLGRGLFLLGLLQSDHIAITAVTPYLAVDRQIEKHKEEYYFVLNACSNGHFLQDAKKYKLGNFLDFMIKMIDKSFDDIDVYRQKFTAIQQLSASAQQVLDCFNNYLEVRLNTKQIVEKTELPRRTVINALNNLLAGGVIQKYGRAAGTRYQITF